MGKSYKPITSMKEVPEQLRKLRRQYLRYQQAEIIYSISHKKLFELASDAGAIYRIDGTVLINRDIFDAYLFLRFKLDENLLYIYDLNINSEEFGKYPANKTQTIQEQKNQGRRPHVSLQTLFVDANNLEPDIIFDIRRCKAYNRVSEYYQRLIGK